MTIACCLFVLTAHAQTYLGYTNGTVSRKDGQRFGTASKQGLAIYVPAEKAAALKGKTLKGIRAAFSTSQVSSLQIFLAKHLGETETYKCSTSGAATSFTDFLFDEAQTLDGEAFYVGYTLTVSSTYSPHLFDASADFREGTAWGLSNGSWIDVSSQGLGAPNLQMILDETPDFFDVVLKPLSVSGFMRQGDNTVLKGQVFNFGTKPLDAFSVSYQLGNDETKTVTFKDVALEPGKTYTYTLANVNPADNGRLPVSLSLQTDNDDEVDLTDNSTTTTALVYPDYCKKKVLVEMFTGQDCGVCPTGHAVVKNALNSGSDEYVMVAHHSGYEPDVFTMLEDIDYTWFYNSSGTYAPGVMFNRMPYSSTTSSAVVVASNASSVTPCVTAVHQVDPYLTVRLGNAFDEATRKGTLTVQVNTHEVPSGNSHRLNVFIVQDGVVARQSSGGSNYVHDHIYRGNLTGTWGENITLEEGGEVVRTFEYDMPENIYSTYNNVKVPVVLENMKFVAFVSDVTSSPLTSVVWNVEEVGLLEQGQISAVHPVSREQLPIHFSLTKGTLQVVGDAAETEVFTPAGLRVGHLYGNGEIRLESGCYVVRARTADGRVTTRKVSL